MNIYVIHAPLFCYQSAVSRAKNGKSGSERDVSIGRGSKDTGPSLENKKSPQSHRILRYHASSRRSHAGEGSRRLLQKYQCQHEWCANYLRSAIAAATYDADNSMPIAQPGESWRGYLNRICVDDGLRASARFLTPWLTYFMEVAHREVDKRPKSQARNVCLSAFDTSLENCSSVWGQLIDVVYPELNQSAQKRLEDAASLTCPKVSSISQKHSSVRGTKNGQAEGSKLVCRLRELTAIAKAESDAFEQCRARSDGPCATKVSRSSRALLEISRAQELVPCSRSPHYALECL